ncbi:MAG: hypothetical protein KC419_23345 [Anaerolineales bacterium]|nr:hypothetical protein [Anaerolineales bacterium]
MKTKSADRRGSVFGGLIVIAIGVWFLMASLGVNLPNIGNLWPIFPTIGGLAFLFAYVTGSEKDPGFLIPGVGGFLVGLFFFLFTFGIYEWAEMGRLWPVFPLIGGIAFLAMYLAVRDGGLLVPAFGGIGVGVVGLLFTLTGVSLAWIGTYWPVILIVVGLIILAQNLFGRK